MAIDGSQTLTTLVNEGANKQWENVVKQAGTFNNITRGINLQEDQLRQQILAQQLGLQLAGAAGGVNTGGGIPGAGTTGAIPQLNAIG